MSEIAPTLLPILRQHHAELDTGHAFDPDWDQLFHLERAGVLRIATLRSDDTLIGYVAWIVAKPLSSRTVHWATVEAYWLAPEWREGWTGYRMLKQSMDELKQAGVQGFDAHVNDKLPRVSLLFKRMGFSRMTSGYRRS